MMLFTGRLLLAALLHVPRMLLVRILHQHLGPWVHACLVFLHLHAQPRRQLVSLLLLSHPSAISQEANGVTRGASYMHILLKQIEKSSIVYISIMIVRPHGML